MSSKINNLARSTISLNYSKRQTATTSLSLICPRLSPKEPRTPFILLYETPDSVSVSIDLILCFFATHSPFISTILKVVSMAGTVVSPIVIIAAA